MGSSLVSIGEHGFWMRDEMLELTLLLLSLHLPEPLPGEVDPVAIAIRNRWLLHSHGFSGAISAGVDEYVAIANGREVMLAAIASLRRALQSAPSQLDGRTLKLLGRERDWGDVETAALLEVARAFEDLIEGRITQSVTDKTFMPGTTKSRRA